MNKLLSIFLVLLCIGCHAQEPIVGGPCEGCEAVFEYGNERLNAVDTIPGFEEYAPQVKLFGTIYQKDGKTPAPNVILYLYQTNREGLYARLSEADGWGRRHGMHRGWIKTNATGEYTFYTFRPAAYPGGVEPEHIHITIKEPNRNEYYIDEFVFDDDPLLTKMERRQLENRAGSGIIQLKNEGGLFIGKRDIYLGKNIPNYE